MSCSKGFHARRAQVIWALIERGLFAN